MILKASEISGTNDSMVQFAAPPEFLQPMTQAWLDHNVPSMPDESFSRLLTWLREKGWNQSERNLSSRVRQLGCGFSGQAPRSRAC
jgi:hypothetical protein